jgi:predicted outer membrane repeat protein
MEPLECRQLLTAVTVNTALDVVDDTDGYTSLREALAYANSHAGDDTIVFDSSLAGKTITLTNGQLTISDTTGMTTIIGLGDDQLTISGNRTSRVFFIEERAKASISGLTITQGAVFPYYGCGGGINNVGDLTITNCNITNNSAAYSGGGLSTKGPGTTTIRNCVFSENTAEFGGAVSGSTLIMMSDSTISGNHATEDGGGIYGNGTQTITRCTIINNSASSGGGVFLGYDTVLTDCTIAHNSADTIGGGVLNCCVTNTIVNCTIIGNTAGVSGGGIYGYKPDTPGYGPESLVLTNTIVTDNASTKSPDIDGMVKASYCLIGDTTGTTLAIPSANNLIGVAPKLGALGDYGGPTQTIPLLNGSPAINAGSDNCASNIDTDQRGYERLVGKHVDIGAYEYGATDVTPPTITLTVPSTTNTTTLPISVTLVDITNDELDTIGVFLDIDMNHDGVFSGGGDRTIPVTQTLSDAWSTLWTSLSLTEGTYQLRARAYDMAGNAGIATATVTVDTTAPTSSVAAFPLLTMSKTFDVSWSGSDSDIGSGIAYYDVYVSDDGGDFVLWKSQTTETSGSYTGEYGHYYAFYSVATDKAGNVEATPNTAVVAQIADNYAPTVDMIVLNKRAPNTNDLLTAQVEASDANKDKITFTYSWKVNGVVVQESTDNTLDLSKEGFGNVGDVITVTVTPNDGTVDGQTLTNAGVTVVNSAPTVTVKLDNASPKTNDLLTATANASDADGDSVSLVYQWKVNGVVVQESADNTFDLSVAGHGDLHDIITVTVTPNDGACDGTPVTSENAVVANTAPAVSVAIDTTSPKTNDLLTAVVNATDADGTPLTLRYVWYVNGIVVKGSTENTLDLSNACCGDVGDTITVMALYSDGEANGTVVGGNPAVVADTAPVVSVTLSNDSPKSRDVLTAVTNVQDADGDQVALNYQWSVNGVVVQNSSQKTLDLGIPGYGDVGDVISVIVTSNDGTLDGAAATSENATVVNSAPTVTAHLNKDRVTKNDSLSVIVSANDVDGDPIGIMLVWDVNGVVQTDCCTIASGETVSRDIAWDPASRTIGDVLTLDVGAADEVSGSWDVTLTATAGDPLATVGFFDAATRTVYLRNSNTDGSADTSFVCSQATKNSIAIVGDWNGDGLDTLGLYEQATGKVSIWNGVPTGNADETFYYGPAGNNWTPLAGDWDGDGKDTIGLFNASNSTFYLKNTLAGGKADLKFQYGPAGSNWTAMAGDWDGNGVDTIGLFNAANSTFYLKNTNAGGKADLKPQYGPAGCSWTAMAGDWNGDGTDTIGFYGNADHLFRLKNTNAGGKADLKFQYGSATAGWTPLAGVWDTQSPLMAAAGENVHIDNVSSLTRSELAPIVDAAISRLANQCHLDADAFAKLKNTQIVVTDLADGTLGMAQGDTVYLDSNAAGYGWFADSTPNADEEYQLSADGKELKAVASEAIDRIDLLTVVEHELGHVLGHVDVEAALESIMSESLPSAVRRSVFDAEELLQV